MHLGYDCTLYPTAEELALRIYYSQLAQAQYHHHRLTQLQYNL